MRDCSPSEYAQRAREQQVPIMSDQTWEYVHLLLLEKKPKKLLEIGTAVGRGSYRMATTIASRGGTIDSYELSYPSYHCARWFRNHTQTRNLHCYYQNFMTLDLTQLSLLDFVFIDAMKAQYAEYLHKIRPYCHADTVIVCDDVIMHHDKMETFWNYLDTEQLAYTIIPLGDGDGVAVIKGVNNN